MRIFFTRVVTLTENFCSSTTSHLSNAVDGIFRTNMASVAWVHLHRRQPLWVGGELYLLAQRVQGLEQVLEALGASVSKHSVFLQKWQRCLGSAENLREDGRSELDAPVLEYGREAVLVFPLVAG